MCVSNPLTFIIRI